LIVSTLSKNKGNKSAAARELGMSRRTLYRRMEELGLLEK
jgi:transcriptional regulator of acetoin/glycerol metabolism